MKTAVNFGSFKLPGGCLKKHLLVKPIHSTNPANGEHARLFLLVRIEQGPTGRVSHLETTLGDCHEDRDIIDRQVAAGTWRLEEPLIVPWAALQAYVRRNWPQH